MDSHLSNCARLILAAVAVVVAEPSAAASPPPAIQVASEPEQVLLDFEIGVLLPSVGQRFQAQISEPLGKALVEAGYRITTDPEAANAKVSIKVVAFDEDLREYEVQIVVQRGDIGTVLEPLRCTACTESRLFDRVLEEAPNVLAALEPPRIEGPSELVKIEPAVRAAERVRPIGGVGIAGCLLMGGGMAAIGSSLPLILGEHSHGRLDIASVDRRYPGYALLGTGVAMAITGVALLASDVRKRKSSKRSNYAVLLGPTYAGFHIAHQF